MNNKLDKMINQNFLLRIISAIVIGLSILYAVFGSLFSFFIIIMLVMSLMIKEWTDIASNSRNELVYGLSIISFSILSLVLVRLFNYGYLILFWYFVIIWTFDTFSMIGGKLIGGMKIAEKISPGKTWTGLLCGGYFATLIGVTIYEVLISSNVSEYKMFTFGSALPISVILLAAFLGDLLESYYKRKFNIKDSSSFIPGHGGFLDRFDSILISAPILLIFTLL